MAIHNGKRTQATSAWGKQLHFMCVYKYSTSGIKKTSGSDAENEIGFSFIEKSAYKNFLSVNGPEIAVIDTLIPWNSRIKKGKARQESSRDGVEDKIALC